MDLAQMAMDFAVKTQQSGDTPEELIDRARAIQAFLRSPAEQQQPAGPYAKPKPGDPLILYAKVWGELLDMLAWWKSGTR
jgi:hypothetical protein